jgi:DNA-binding phage protein
MQATVPSVSDVEKIRANLREIGQRRVAQGVETEALAEDTKKAITHARGILSMTEIAKLVGLDRSSIYTTYGASGTK